MYGSADIAHDSAVFVVIALCICTVVANRSKKAIAKPVAMLDLAIIPPLIGNLILINSNFDKLSKIGYYVYFIGMDLMVLALIGFAMAYCKGANGSHKTPKLIYVLLGIDVCQELLNPFFHHSFDVESVTVNGEPYFRLIPHIGQIFHRVVDYTILVGIILIFTVVSVKTPKIYKERYVVSLVTIVTMSAWESFYIITRTPVDRSMIGFGLADVLIFYFSIMFRPLRFLDRMLSDIASDMQQSLFVFDPDGRCIWANEQGMKLTCTEARELDSVPEKLTAIFGDIMTAEDTTFNKTTGSEDSAKYFTLQRRIMTGSKQPYQRSSFAPTSSL